MISPRRLAALTALSLAATLAPHAARSQSAPPAPAAPPAASSDPGDSDVVEVGGAVRSLPRVLFVPADAPSQAATREMARLVALTGIYATTALAPGAAAGGLVVKVQSGQDAGKTWIEAVSTPSQGRTLRRRLTLDDRQRGLDQARLADAIVADLSGERSHLSGTLLFVDAGTPGERRVRVMLASGEPVRDVSPPDLLARGADTQVGGKVYYAAGRAGEPLALHVEGSSAPVEVKVPGFVQSVTFASDGRVALVAGEREGGALWVGRLGGILNRVDIGSGIAITPSFGPDSRLTYATGPATGPLRVVVDGKPVSPPGAWASAPSFCNRTTREGTPRSRIVYMLKQGESWSTQITDLEGGGQTVGTGSFPACSPDGRSVAVGRAQRGKSKGGVWLTGEDGIASHRIHEGEIAGLRWSAGPPLPPEG